MLKKFAFPAIGSLVGFCLSCGVALAADPPYVPLLDVVDGSAVQATACLVPTPLTPEQKAVAAVEMQSKKVFMPLLPNGESGPMCVDPQKYTGVIALRGADKPIIASVKNGAPVLNFIPFKTNALAASLTNALIYTDSVSGELVDNAEGFTHYKLYRMDRPASTNRQGGGDSPADLNEVLWADRAEEMNTQIQERRIPRISMMSTSREMYLLPMDTGNKLTPLQICPQLGANILVDVQSVGVEKTGGHWVAWVFYKHTTTTVLNCPFIAAWQFAKLAEFWADFDDQSVATVQAIIDRKTSIYPAALYIAAPEMAPILGSAKMLPYVGRGVEYIYIVVNEIKASWFVLELSK